MRVRFILRFLLILLVSILFSVSSRFLWLQIIEVYNEEKHTEYNEKKHHQKLNHF